MRVAVTVLATAMAFAALGCGEGDEAGDPTAPPPTGAPDKIEMEVPAEHEAGAEFVATSGCLACHQVGENGNDGPGRPLTQIGSRRTTAEIYRALVRGPNIMPSYADAPRAELRAAARFLASLR